MMSDRIEVAEILPVSEVNGPGRRCVIWVKGCRKRCPGCWNTEYLGFGKGKWSYTSDELFDAVKRISGNFKDIEGVTLSGGEPFEQSRELAEAAYLFKKNDLSVMSYSGFTLNDIHDKGRPFTDLLSQLDILVDGEYRHELHCDRMWRSSTNQQIHFLTERYRHLLGLVDNEIREFEVTLSSDHMMLTGFPEHVMLGSFK